MGERLERLKTAAANAAENPVLRERAAKHAGTLARAAMTDIVGKDGEVKKRKVVRRALRPVKSARRAITHVGKEAHRIAREEGTEVAREGGKRVLGQMEAGRSHSVRTSSSDDFWEGEPSADYQDRKAAQRAEDKASDDFWNGDSPDEEPPWSTDKPTDSSRVPDDTPPWSTGSEDDDFWK